MLLEINAQWYIGHRKDHGNPSPILDIQIPARYPTTFTTGYPVTFPARYLTKY